MCSVQSRVRPDAHIASRRRGFSARCSYLHRRAFRLQYLQPLLSWFLIFVILSQPNLVVAASISASVNRRTSSPSRPANITVPAIGSRVLAATTSTVQHALTYLSSFLDAGKGNETGSNPVATNVPLATAINPDHSITVAAISKTTPNINSGRIEGAFRIFEGKSFSLNHGFTLAGDLYVVGTPTIRANNNASYNGTVNDGGNTAPSGYGITLNNGTTILGTIHTRANAIPLPTDIPTSVPAPAGTRVVNISSPADVASVGDWKTVADLNINAAGVTVNLPPGNYRRLNINASSTLNLTAGDYNFSDNVNLNGGTTHCTGKVTISIAQTYNVNSGKLLLGTNTLPGDVRLNVLGGTVNLNHGTQLSALLRAPNGKVHLNGNSIVRGQVIAGTLHINNDSKIVGDVSLTDNTPPLVNITAPANGASTIEETITVIGTAADTGASATGILRVTVNNTPAAFDATTGQWTLASVPLALGANTITARAADRAGNQSSAQISVTRLEPPRDTTPPAVVITSPAHNSTATTATVTVNGTVSDGGTPASGVARVTVNGQNATLNTSSGMWTLPDVALSVGANQMTAVAFDNAGNQSSASINVNRELPPDTQAPRVAITTPPDGASTIEENINVSGTASDMGAHASGVSRVMVNGVAAVYDAASSNWTAQNVPLVIGSNRLVAQAFDRAGNHASAEISITRQEPPDTTPPQLSIISPPDGTTTEAANVAINGTVSDASGIAQVTVNDTPATLASGEWTISGVALALGLNALTVRATDRAGNSSTQSIQITRVRPPDAQPPRVVITSPSNNTTVPGPSLVVTGTAFDEGDNATGVRQVTVNGVQAAYDALTGHWSASVEVAEGLNTIRVTAADGAPTPNRAEATISVTRHTPDADAPILNITSPVMQTETYDATINVAGTATDEGLNATGVQHVSVNGKEAAYDAATKRWTATGVALAFGDNIIIVTATDDASPPHESRAEVRITRLRIPPPTISINNPQNGSVYSSGVTTVAGSVASQSPDPLKVTINGDDVSVTGGQYTKTVTLAEGANTITAVVTDSLGQQAQASVSVLRDQTPPSIAFINVPALVQPGATYQIQAQAADNIGVVDVDFSVDGVKVATAATSPYQFALTVPSPLAAGNIINLTAVARDLGGATSTATAQARTTGPGGISGYVFDDMTGYVLEGVLASLGETASVQSSDEGAFSLISAKPTGTLRLMKDGYTTVERTFTVSAGEGTALFDARLTRLDAQVNSVGAAGGRATGDGGRLQVDFVAGSLPVETDVRVTSVSPQGLANLLPYGWSPLPGAVIDLRAQTTGDAPAPALASPAHLRISQLPYPVAAGSALTLARYDEATHVWIVTVTNLSAGQGTELEAVLPTLGQYAFLVADTGASAPPAPGNGLPLTSARPASPASLDAATASAISMPRTASYSADARSTISFVADAPTQLPSGISIEATIDETYHFLGGKDSMLVGRPAQDFVLYAFPGTTAGKPNRVAAYFVAKPTRTDLNIYELLNANLHVEIRSGRQSKTGVLIGAQGGGLFSGNGAQLIIQAGALQDAHPVFFGDVSATQTGVELPDGYEIVGAFDVDLTGASLSKGASISIPTSDTDASRIVLARLLTVGGQRAPKAIAGATAADGRLVSSVAAPPVPAGVSLDGVRASGRYVFIKMPHAFGFVKGLVMDAGSPASLVKISNDQTPFIDLTGAGGSFVLPGNADAPGLNQLGAASIVTDAIGRATTTLAAQGAVADADISLSTAPLMIESLSPADGAQSVIATTPVTVTFNKPVAAQSLTNSNFKLATSNGAPVLGQITVLAGNRVAVFTPGSILAGSTTYKVSLTQSVRDIYGKPLSGVFASTFTTSTVVKVDERLKPEKVKINYPDAGGTSRIVIPSGAVPEGAIIIAVNETSGTTVSTIAGASGIELDIPAQVGDRITLIIRQPDGIEYRVSQAAYRRADGFTSVGINGGTVTSDDGRMLIEIPQGAITGQADIQVVARAESDFTTPRTDEMEPSNAPFGAGMQIRAQGSYKVEKELHVEIAVPAGVNVQEGQRVAFMTPDKMEWEGEEIDVWRVVTSGKVEGGKFKTMSPPFTGLSLPEIIGTLALVNLAVFVPLKLRAVHGIVTESVAGAAPVPVSGARCYITGRFGGKPIIMTETADNGRFGTLSFVAYESNIEVEFQHAGRTERAVASPYLNIEPQKFPGLFGIQTMYASIEFPQLLLRERPAQLDIQVEMSKAEGERDTLKELGIVPVGKTINVFAINYPSVAVFTGTLRVNGIVGPTLTWSPVPKPANFPDGTEVRGTTLVVSAEGNYSIEIETTTSKRLPETIARKTFSFIALRNPNTRPPLPGAPKVINVTPPDKATQVDAGSNIHIEFSEPVKNLVAGTTVYVQDVKTGERRGGIITSGGIPVEVGTDGISSIDFTPSGLAGGRDYAIHVATDVLDSDRHHLDQDYTGEDDDDFKEFTSDFRTFSGIVLTESSPVKDSGVRIAAAGQYVATISPNTTDNNSTLSIYDMSDPAHPSGPVKVFVPLRAVALAMVEIDEGEAPFHVGSPEKVDYTRLAFVTTASVPVNNRPNNLWIYDLSKLPEAKIVGVVSLSIPSSITAVPVSIAIHNKRAYVGNVSYNGVNVIDIEKALAEWAEARRNVNRIGYLDPQVLAVKPNGGFALDAKVQTALHGAKPTGNPSHSNSVSVIEQTVKSPAFADVPVKMPVAYVASQFKTELISFGLHESRDGQNGFADFVPRDEKEDRLLLAQPKPLEPSANVIDVRAVADANIKGGRQDLALLLGYSRLYIFNVTNPTEPAQYTSKTFAAMGVDAGLARRMEVEGTLVYVTFADRVAVLDFSDPENPALVATLDQLGGNLNSVAVRDGFIYTLSQGTSAHDGLNVSIARPASQVFAYGANASAPDSFCANPVIINRTTKRMAQPAGIFFQVFGHALPHAAQVIIRKEKIVGTQTTEEVLATLAASISDQSNDKVIVGRVLWNSDAVIDTSAKYTAEVVFDEGVPGEFHSRREPIPFSTLIGEYQKSFGVANGKGLYGYILGGQAKVTLTVEGKNRLVESSNTNDPPRIRSYGLNVNEVKLDDLFSGTYQFTLRAELDGNPAIFDEVFGEVSISLNDNDVRLPGSTVVNGVELSRGNLGLTYNDVLIKNRGLSLDFTRSYNTAAADSFGPLGYGWGHNYQVLLLHRTFDTPEANFYAMSGGDGSSFIFKEKKASGGEMQAEDPHQGTLVKNLDGSFDFFTRERVKYHFPGAIEDGTTNFFNGGYMGNLEYIEDTNANRLTLTYDAQGRMTRVTDPSRRALVFTYEQADTPFVGVVSPSLAGDISCTSKKQFGIVRGRFNQADTGTAWRITKVEGPSGLSITYAYDDAGNLTNVTRKGENQLSRPTTDRVWQYAYNAQAPPGTRADVRHLLTSVTSPNDTGGGTHVTTYDYYFDQLRTPVKSISFPEGVANRFTYTRGAQNNVTQAIVVDGRQNPTEYNFDEHGYATRVISPRGAETLLGWNNKGQKEYERDPEGRVTRIRYERGNPVSQTIEGGGKIIGIETAYDPRFNKPISITDGNHHTTVHHLDSRGNLFRVDLPTGRSIVMDYAANGDLRSVTDKHNLVTKFSYDAYGNAEVVEHEVSPGAKVTTRNTFDALSRLITSEGTLEPSIINTYDAHDRVVEVVISDPTGIRDSFTTTYEYYPAGQIKKESRVGGTQRFDATHIYDHLERLRSRSENVSGAGEFVMTYTYDGNSNLLTEKDRRGVTRTYTYDALNLRDSTTVSGPFGVERMIEKIAEFDRLGNPRTLVDMYGKTTTLEYDGLHRMVKRTLPGDYVEEIDYDANGNTISFKDRNRRESTTKYDSINRPIERKNAAGHITTWTYDDATQTTTLENWPQGLITVRQTDAIGRPLREQYKFNPTSYTTTYEYIGRTVKITDPRHIVTNKTLSAFGEPGSITVEGAKPAWEMQMRYAAFGQLKTRRDANARQTVFTVDGLNRVTAVQHPASFTEQYTYDGEGKLLSHTDRRGTITEATYDNLRRTLTTKVRHGAEQIQLSTHSYDDASSTATVRDAENHSTVTVFDGLRRPISVTNAGGQTKTFEYDGINLLRESDFKGQFTGYEYDQLDRVVEMKDRQGHVTTVNNSDRSGLTKRITNRRGYQTIEVYDALGRLRSVTSGGEAVAFFEYDGNSNRTTRRDGRGGLTSYTYDALNRLTSANHASLQTETYTYDAVGNLLSYNDGAGAAITQTFDELDHLKTRTDGENNTTSYRYDGEGLLLEQTDPKQHRTSYQYNALGSLVGLTDAKSGAWELAYNGDQTLKSIKDALGRTVSYAYDLVMRLKSVTQPGQITTSYDYDPNGNRTSVVDPKGQTVSVVYDGLDRAQTVRFANTQGAGPRKYDYNYDPEDNITSVNETYTTDGVATLSRSFARTYDSRDRLETTTDPYGHQVAYTYDPTDNVKTFTDAAGKQTLYDYDTLNRLQTVKLAGGATVGYTWRADGLLEKVSYPAGMERSYAYDNADRLKSLVNIVGGNVTDEYAYTYDRASNRETESKKFNGNVFRQALYTYDELDRLVKVGYGSEPEKGLRGEYFDNPDFTNPKLTRTDATLDFGWPSLSSPDPSIDSESFSVRWTGQVEPLHTETYTFHLQTDEGARLWVDGQLIIDHWEAHTSTELTGTVRLTRGRKHDIRMEYREDAGDAEARLLWSSQSQNKQVVPQSHLNVPPTAIVARSEVAYTYDAVGNRLSASGTDINGASVNQTYKYDDLNRLTSLTGGSGGDLAYTYDYNGNMLEAKQAGQVMTRYEYDARDQLRRVVNGANQEVGRYDYDAERRRLAKTFGGVERQYVYGGGNLVDEYDPSGQLVNRFDYGTDLVRSTLADEGERWHFSDGTASVTALASVVQATGTPAQEGQVAARYEYGAWGELVAGGGSSNQFGYTGQRLDAETALMTLGNGERYYSPGLGRFIQQDSWTGKASMPQSINRYSYAYNNPHNFIDPSGNEPFSVAGILAISFLTHVTINAISQTAQINSGERRQEDFNVSEAFIDGTIIGQSYNFATGEDVMTGRRLTGGQRAMAGGEVALEFLSVFGKAVGATSKMANVARAANTLGNSAEIMQAGIGVYRGGAATAEMISQGRYGAAMATGLLTAVGGVGGYQGAKSFRRDLRGTAQHADDLASVTDDLATATDDVATVGDDVAGAVDDTLTPQLASGAAAKPGSKSFSASRLRALREALTDGHGKLLSSKEREGIASTIRSIEKEGYELLGSVKYQSNHGLDLIFRGVDGNAGRFALAEAKAGAGLGKLVTDSQGIRQGSYEFFRTRLKRGIIHGDPNARALYRTLYSALRAGQADLFAGFAKNNSLFRLNPRFFRENVNFRNAPDAALRIK